jgi:class 3 adenylate cyclase
MELLQRLNDARSRKLLGLAGCLLVALLLHFTHAGDDLNRKVLDRQFALLQGAHPLATDVVVIGIDDAAYKTLREPAELWHPHLGKVLQALAMAEPAVVGLDIVLPEHSYQFLAPQYDQYLLQGLQALRAKSPLVLAQTLDEEGGFRKVHAPYVAAAGGDALASVVVCADSDGVARRFDPNRCTVNARGATLVEKMAAQLGRAAAGTGLVDFASGRPFDYVPLLRVLDWQTRGDVAALQQAFGGRPVLLGVVARSGERAMTPVPLAAWAPQDRNVPAVLVQAQMLRSMLGGGLIREAGQPVVLALMFLAALFCFGRSGWLKLAALLAFPFLLLAFSTWQLGQGWFLPVGGILLSGLFAFFARLAYEGVALVLQRKWLRGTFGNYVSQEVLHEIMAGNIRSGLDASRQRVSILFADIHGFSARSEDRPPQEVVALLNDYFSEMTIAIHQHNGTVDKFIGDGIMAFFGAPQALVCPEKNALEAAQEMLLRLRLVNARLQEQGIAPIEIGIALHVGEVVIGHIGSGARHEYTIIGDAVSLTARLEELTKPLHYPVVCSAAVAKAVEQAGGLVDCGEQSVKGGRVQVYGWKPPLLAEQ